MKIKFLGTGGAFDYKYGNSSALVEFKGKKILLDCGNSVYPRLRQSNLANDIDYIMITHLHDDHVGSLNTIILHHKYFVDPPRKARIIIPSSEFQDQLAWFISFGMPHPERYVEFIPISQVEGIEAVDTFGMHIKNMHTYGYYFEDEKEILAYSGDLGDPNVIFDHIRAKNSDKKIRVFHEMSFFHTDGVHAYYKDLSSKTEEFELYAYHLDHTKEPPDNTVPLVANFPEFLV